MKLILSSSLSAGVNLAAEEYWFDKLNEPFSVLWRNGKSVIIGVNQNAYSEVDLSFAERENIPVVRRLTGGGAVFHDEGNINYTSVSFGDFDYSVFAEPIIRLLSSYGIEATVSGRNDILVGGRKFSGCARRGKAGKTLCHCTVMFSCDLNLLSSVLTPSPEKYISKGIKSVSSRVMNLSELLPSVSVSEFMTRFTEILSEKSEIYIPSDEDLKCISDLAEKKYFSREWNYGYSPEFTYGKTVRTEAGTVEVYLKISEGKISSASLFGDFFSLRPIVELCDSLKGTEYSRKGISDALKRLPVGEYICGLSAEELSDCLI